MVTFEQLFDVNGSSPFRPQWRLAFCLSPGQREQTMAGIEHDLIVELYGAFHHKNSSNPRYKLNTDHGRFETIDESVCPNEFVSLVNRDGIDEPMWDNAAAEVILTIDPNGRVINIQNGPAGHHNV